MNHAMPHVNELIHIIESSDVNDDVRELANKLLKIRLQYAEEPYNQDRIDKQ